MFARFPVTRDKMWLRTRTNIASNPPITIHRHTAVKPTDLAELFSSIWTLLGAGFARAPLPPPFFPLPFSLFFSPTRSISSSMKVEKAFYPRFIPIQSSTIQRKKKFPRFLLVPSFLIVPYNRSLHVSRGKKSLSADLTNLKQRKDNVGNRDLSNRPPASNTGD